MNTQLQPIDLLAVDLSAKYAFVEELTKSWALALFGSAEPSKVTKEQVAIAEVKPNLFSTSFFLTAIFSSTNPVELFARPLPGR